MENNSDIYDLQGEHSAAHVSIARADFLGETKMTAVYWMLINTYTELTGPSFGAPEPDG